MRRLYFILFLFSVCLVTFNCQKEISFTSEPIQVKEPITATVQGNILDENGFPLTGVRITVGTKETTTDSKGFFRVTNAALDKKASLVIAEMPGYFKALRSFSATSGTNNIRIKLTRKILAGTIESGNGGSAELPNGSKVIIPANAVTRTGGGSYSGQVRVYLNYIDPSEPDISAAVPGSFMANDRNNNRVTLASFGMLAVELESTAGEELQLASDASATIISPIPASLNSSAPTSVPLWHLDEKTGIWKEEGSATKSGNNYIGEVKHFSFWNCDIGVPVVFLQATLHTVDGEPLLQATVRLTYTSPTSGVFYFFANTDSLGQVAGFVPANAILVMDVMGPCNAVVHSQPIGPFNQHTNLGIVTVTNNTSLLVTIKGVLKDCAGQPVSNGYVMITLNDWTTYAGPDIYGKFSVTLLYCTNAPSSVSLTGVDNAGQVQGNALTLSIPSNGVVDAGDLVACGVSTEQYIHYTLDGNNFTMSSALSDSIFTFQQSMPTLNTRVISYKGNNIFDRLNLFFYHGTGPGTYSMDDIKVHTFDSVTLAQPFNVVLTTYPSTTGQFYEGSFSGSFTEFNTTTPIHTISGTFRLRRLF